MGISRWRWYGRVADWHRLLFNLLFFVLCGAILAAQPALAQNFTYQAEMGAMRYGHSVTLLPSGKVLIAGGYNDTSCLNSADIYDPKTGAISKARPMLFPRKDHSATLMANGKVLIVGGRNGLETVKAAEIFDPATGVFNKTKGTPIDRIGHSSTLLPSGKVLISGGTTGNAPATTAEIYDPKADSFVTLPSKSAARMNQNAILLQNGKVLITGGLQDDVYVATAEIFDPTTGKFAVTGSMTTPRSAHSATLLADGKVLIVGGRNGSNILQTAEIFDPATGSFTAVSALGSGRSDCTSTLLPNGTVLVAGGRDEKGYLSSAEVFDPASGVFVPTVNMTSVRDVHSAILLQNGTVLITGGWNGLSAASSAEIFNPELPKKTYKLLLNMVGNEDVTVGFSPGEKCSGTCNQWFPAGTMVNLSPVLSENSQFLGWSGCDSTSGTVCSVAMNDNRLVKLKSTGVTASGSANQVAITATAGPHGAISPAGITMVDRFGNLTYTITADTGYHIEDVLVDGSNDLGAIDTFTFTNVKESHTISATFALDGAFTITAGVTDPATGSISPSGPVSVKTGNSQSFTATPAAGYAIQDLIVDNTSVGAVTDYTFTDVTANHSITASFARSVFTITATAGPDGTITPEGPSSVTSGSNQSYTITAAANYQVKDVVVDGTSVGAVTSYTFSNVTANHTIAATFTPIVYTVTASAGANGSITPEGATGVKSGTDQSYAITPALNYKVADVVVDGVSAGAVTSYTFFSVNANHTIAATFTPIVYTIVATEGPNGSISPAGTTSVNSGTSRSYTITAAPNYKVAEVVVDGVSVGAVTSYSFENITANHSIAATFTPIIYNITATAGANGSITPAGTTQVNSGSSQSYTISAAANYQVANVVADGVSLGSVSTYSFTNVTANHTIAATFAPIVYTITASAGPNGTVDPAGALGVNAGSDQSYTITAAANFKVADVLVDGASVGPVTSYSFTNVSAGHTLSATFTPIVYTITATAGVNGTIDPAGASSVNSGTTKAYTILADAHYRIADVQVDGVSVGAVSSYSFENITANHTIAATFTPIVYTVTASAGANGTIDPVGPREVNSGTSAVYAITPLPNYKIADVVVDGNSVGATTSYTFSNITGDHTIAATFAPIIYTITATADANGSVTPAGSTDVISGSTHSYAITPSPNYKVANVLVDGSSVGAVTSYTFVNVTGNHTISATFTPIIYQISASAGANGSITPVGATSIASGSSITYTITPSTGSTATDSYKVAAVLVDGKSVGALRSYTLANVTADHTITAAFTPLEASLDYFIVTATAGFGGSISSAGDSVLYPHENSPVYSIAAAQGYDIAQVTVDGVAMGPITSYAFADVTANHTITASFTLKTYAVIATAGANGSVTPAGTSEVPYGGSVTYTITPAAGYRIADVQLDGKSLGAVPSYTVSNVTADHSLTAAFVPITYRISASAGANGSITPVGESILNSGASITYTITPIGLYRIADVQVDGVSAGKLSSYTFTSVSADHTITASFEPLVAGVDYFAITASTTTSGGNITPAGTTNVLKGANSPVYTVTPDTGYVIVSIGDNGVQIAKRPAAPYTYTFTNVLKAHALTASFQLATFTLTPIATGNGTISPAYPVSPTYGSSYYFRFTPAAGYHIGDVLLDGTSLGPVDGYNFTNITANHTIEARFEANAAITISASAGPNGSISPAGDSSVLSGSNVTYTMTPAPGYRVADVVVDGVSKGALTSYTFTKVSAVNHTIAVSFTLNVYTITAAAGANGAITPSGVTTNIAPGASLTYTFTPALGYKVASIVVDGSSKGAADSYTFTNIMADHTISVSFTQITYTITQSAGEGGVNYPNTPAYIGYGGNATYTIQPSPGYHVTDVLVDGVSVGAVSTYTFTNVTADHTIQSVFGLNPTVTITATAGDNGTISPAGAVPVVSGKSITFTFTPAAAYRVADVVVDNVSKGPLSSYTFTNVSAQDHTITVSFTFDSYIISTNAGAGGTISPSANVAVAKGGDSPMYTVTPNPGYLIVSVGDNGRQLAKEPTAPYTYTFTNVTANHVLSAAFRLQTFTITPIVGANGSMSPAYAVYPTYGASQYCTITANPGYHVKDVLIDGTSVGPVTSYNFTNITANHTIESIFEANPAVTVTAGAGAGGTITPSGAISALTGTSPTFTFTPDSGYRIAAVTVDGNSVGTPSSYTFSKIAANHDIAVTFTENIYTINAITEPNGTITPAGKTIANGGDSITYTITPDPGYKVLNVEVDGVFQGALTSYTFSNISANHTIDPSFALITP
ncbi:hypothetical protein KOM00_19395 [Geomonas sp. Red69]|uniref:InlB B-repeat-containing protein n=1 Tax=Geomonas diazotrophica TaxID=2843197 RepID=UPI001C101F43|nr:kelch repeat-containing protein [Geomonas diazotrophica]MBU5638894.1 hypothetical protein [Geomonas diazotrophica]